MVLHQMESTTGNLVLTELKHKLANVKCLKADISSFSDEGLTLEMSAFKLFTVANLCFQLSC